jgi:hypothetical protein
MRISGTRSLNYRVSRILSKGRQTKFLCSRNSLGMQQQKRKATNTRGGNLSRKCSSKTLKLKKSRRRQRPERKSAECLKERMLLSRMHSGKLRFAHHLAMFINKLIEELLKFFKRRIIVLMFQD